MQYVFVIEVPINPTVFHGASRLIVRPNRSPRRGVENSFFGCLVRCQHLFCESFKCECFVSSLLLVLARISDKSRVDMRDPDARIGFVSMLSACATSPKRINTKILLCERSD
jgi:hypothetical protein